MKNLWYLLRARFGCCKHPGLQDKGCDPSSHVRCDWCGKQFYITGNFKSLLAPGFKKSFYDD